MGRAWPSLEVIHFNCSNYYNYDNKIAVLVLQDQAVAGVANKSSSHTHWCLCTHTSPHQQDLHLESDRWATALNHLSVRKHTLSVLRITLTDACDARETTVWHCLHENQLRNYEHQKHLLNVTHEQKFMQKWWGPWSSIVITSSNQLS